MTKNKCEENENDNRRKDDKFRKKYNWYIKKVINVKSAQGIKTIEKAIASLIKENNGSKEEDFYDYVDIVEREGKTDISVSGEVEIALQQVGEKAILVSIDEIYPGYEDVYYHDLFIFIDDYLAKIAEHRCPSCGEEITGKGKFCSNCGATL